HRLCGIAIQRASATRGDGGAQRGQRVLRRQERLCARDVAGGRTRRTSRMCNRHVPRSVHATCPWRRARATGPARDRASASRGTADAAFSRMKPILFLALLALGPALAEQFPVTPPRLAPAAADAARTSG